MYFPVAARGDCCYSFVVVGMDCWSDSWTIATFLLISSVASYTEFRRRQNRKKKTVTIFQVLRKHLSKQPFIWKRKFSLRSHAKYPEILETASIRRKQTVFTRKFRNILRLFWTDIIKPWLTIPPWSATMAAPLCQSLLCITISCFASASSQLFWSF